MTRFNLSIAILACSIATSSIAAPGNVRYRLTLLDPSLTASADVRDINNRGEVVGVDGNGVAFLWNGQLVALGPLLDPESPVSRAQAINDRSDIVGNYTDGIGRTHNFLLQGGAVNTIQVIGNGAVQPADINNRRQVVGTAFDAQFIQHGFIWRRGESELLESPPGGEFCCGGVRAVNAHGVAVGVTFVSDRPRAVLWKAVALNERGVVLGTSDGATRHVVIWEDAAAVDLAIPAGAVPRDINDREQVTGTLQRHGFLWERGIVTQLPSLEGALITEAANLNNAGEIVGTSSLPTGSRATLWEDEQVFDLNGLIRRNDPLRSFVTLVSASSINDRGAIVATGRDSRAPTELRTYLLTAVH